jgi:hypothetical protein
MLLSDFLNDLSIFEVVEYNKTSRGVEICLGRLDTDARSLDAWLRMVGHMLMSQEKEKVDKVSISKQYLIRGNALVYLWKVVCKDSAWISTHMPRIDRTVDAQRNAINNIDPLTGVGEMTLPGVRRPIMMGPQPEDIGMRSEIKTGGGR